MWVSDRRSQRRCTLARYLGVRIAAGGRGPVQQASGWAQQQVDAEYCQGAECGQGEPSGGGQHADRG